MKTIRHMLAVTFLTAIVGCTQFESPVTAQTFTPAFVEDYTDCGSVTLSAGSVQFGDASTSCGGRVVSTEGYTNISQIRFTADLSNATGNFVTSTFYMVNNPNNPSLQPKGSNYCDAGGNNASWNCQETDFFEVNKNVVLQHTMHVGDGSASAPQNFQFSYSTTEDQCFENLAPGTGIVSWNGIDVKQPVDFVIDLDENGMTITIKQGSLSAVVYQMGEGYSGSTTFDSDQLKRWQEGRAQGYWLNLSRWQDDNGSWSPGAPQGFYNWSCPWGGVCGATDSYFKVYNIEIDAEDTI